MRGLKISSLILVCCLGLTGCSAGSGSGAEGVSVEGTPAVSTLDSSAEYTVESAVPAPKSRAEALEFNRPRDENGRPIWPDGVVGRGYEIPPQPKDAPPLPQWVKDFNPEMPEAARQPTEAGAKAFAEYVFASIFFEFNTGTTTLIRSISKHRGADFLAQLDSIDKQVLDGAWLRMSKFEIVSSIVVDSNEDKSGYLVDVTYKASLTYIKGETVETSTKNYTGRASIYSDEEGEWFVYELDFPKNYVE